MRRGLVHALAWSLATGAAVTLSWWGVHSVLSGTVYDPPRALPLPVGTTDDAPALAGGDPLNPLTSSTRNPETSGPPSGTPGGAASARPETTESPDRAPVGTASTAPADPAATGTPGATDPAPASPAGPAPTTDAPAATTAAAPGTSSAAPAPASDSGVKTFTVDGGRVTFDLGESSAELVAATPASGWQMQVWKDPSWIRVTFTGDGREISVFCLWHDGPPHVQVEERKL
ncbi:hypothetical protein AB0G79_06420 [Streptomyces sp. NPDC020807]|uniref:hypothetical protein n=1 Tax=Streptomyces sp. NPDC020807 TaxID=3155119 RepID=UPI003405944D